MHTDHPTHALAAENMQQQQQQQHGPQLHTQLNLLATLPSSKL
jgi:hypothetical protein